MITFGKLYCNVGTVSTEVLEASVLFTRSYWRAHAKQCLLLVLLHVTAEAAI